MTWASQLRVCHQIKTTYLWLMTAHKKHKYSGKSYINRQHGFIPTTASAFGNFWLDSFLADENWKSWSGICNIIQYNFSNWCQWWSRHAYILFQKILARSPPVWRCCSIVVGEGNNFGLELIPNMLSSIFNLNDI